MAPIATDAGVSLKIYNFYFKTLRTPGCYYNKFRLQVLDSKLWKGPDHQSYYFVVPKFESVLV